MQVLCKISNAQSDVHCKICGQGFSIYWGHTLGSEREAARKSIVDGLAQHHVGSNSTHVHPRIGFTVPNWSGAPAFTFAPLFGAAWGR